MSRPTAMRNYAASELIANRAANVVPALPAKKFNGASIQQVGDQFYLVFDWIKGKCLKPSDINADHCKIMGEILSSLHMGDFSDLGILTNYTEEIQPTDWGFYLQRGQTCNAEWTNLLFENIAMLNEWNTLAIGSATQLSSELVISHGDLDPKNVMWTKTNPILIDWESAGYRNPMQDLIETAIYWSETESGELDKAKFSAFLDGYKSTAKGQLQADWGMILASGFLGKLDWLNYNLKRSLGIDCSDQQEQQVGTEQVTGTITAIRHYAKMITEIEGWLKEI